LIAEYRTASIHLKRMGWGSLIWGLLNIVLGTIYTVENGPINAILVLIGLLLVASGLWCLVVRSAAGVITNGIALMLIGLWNLVVTVLNLVLGGPPTFWWAAIGVAMIASAVWGFRQYARFSQGLRHGATSGELAMLDAFAKRVLKADGEHDDNIIGFQVTSYGQQAKWRGRLMRGMAVFVQRVTQELLVASSKDVSINPHGQVLLSSSLKAAITIRDHHWQATMTPRSFDRYRDWKFEEEEEDERQSETPIDESAQGVQLQPDVDNQRRAGIQRKRPAPDEAD
jgi:hypothetical protein